jgi:hypothetical protein
VLLESAPPSFTDMAPELYPWTRFLPLRRIMQTRYETKSHIARCDVPALFIHGDEDEIVPLRYGQMAYEAANDPKRMHIVRGGTHDRPDLVDPERYYAEVTSFIAEYARGSIQPAPHTLAAD